MNLVNCCDAISLKDCGGGWPWVASMIIFQRRVTSLPTNLTFNHKTRRRNVWVPSETIHNCMAPPITNLVFNNQSWSSISVTRPRVRSILPWIPWLKPRRSTRRINFSFETTIFLKIISLIVRTTIKWLWPKLRP